MIGIFLEFHHTLVLFIYFVTCARLQELHKEFGGDKNDGLQIQVVRGSIRV